ncbi:TLR4 interactor with leucine rich repeats-like [Hypomesus transpacificus]|uniref:TLR4 interactor with leucine rich repeats-like n=1 Tax=Hypomesus transpacificus TaxID=137520 RepID=UPI001F07B38B|nr:TLR4 interactor with leucine rich repeats-like [Hypomesus transpacificus]
MESLETLYLENNQIRSLTRNTFRGLRQLHELNISGNMLSCLPNNVFKPVSPLQDLVSSFNVRMQIKNTQFKSQVALKALSVSNNILSKTDLHTFTHLSNLELLKLNGNHIRRIGRYTFSHCAQIREIDLSDNLISTIEESAFADLKHLRVVKLNRNRLSLLDPRAFDSRSQLSSLNLNENPWDCSCSVLCLKRWLEGGADRRPRVLVRCSQPELLRGQYLGAISSALIRGTDRMCSHALPQVNCGPTVIDDATWLSEPNVVNMEDTQKQGEGYIPAPDVIIRNAHKRDISESQRLHNTSGVRVLPTGSKMAKSIPTQTITSTKDFSGKETPACVYNHEVIVNVSSGSVTSTSAVISWSLTKRDTQNVYFRVMYDRFSTRGKFSRFVNVRQGTVCKLCELQPSTPYFVCVESVVQDQVCHVASRDLCLGLITAAEPLPGPEPVTVTMYLTAVNTLAVLGVLVLIGYTWFVLRRHWSSALSLVFSQNRSISCALCAGMPPSDRASGVQTNSSQTGTYVPNDVDAIDMPPVH